MPQGEQKTNDFLEFDTAEDEENAATEYLQGRIADTADSDVVTLSGVTEAYKVLQNQFGKGNDSGSYALVMDSAELVTTGLNERVSSADFATKYGMMVHRYSRLMGACSNYLESHSGFRWSGTGRGRVQQVRKMLQSAQMEVRLLQNQSSIAASSDVPMNWLEVIFGAGAGENGITFSSYKEEVGAGLMSGFSFKSSCQEISEKGGKNAMGLPTGTALDRISALLDQIKIRFAGGPDVEVVRAGALDALLGELDALGSSSNFILTLRDRAAHARMDVSVSASDAKSRSEVMAKHYATANTERMKMRDDLLTSMGNVPATFSGSNSEYNRVVNRMQTDNPEESSRILSDEIFYHQWMTGTVEHNGENYTRIRQSVTAEFNRMAGFRMFGLTDGDIMANYEEILKYDLPSMHVSDIMKEVNPETGQKMRDELIADAEMDEKTVSFINQILGVYRMLGKGLWTLRAIDGGWNPQFSDLDLQDKKHVEVRSDGSIDVNAYRAYVQDNLVNVGHQRQNYLENEVYADIVARLMGY